jgi:endogenous inhibitor of DNA gyrase (YacG/DUF329 family)
MEIRSFLIGGLMDMKCPVCHKGLIKGATEIFNSINDKTYTVTSYECPNCRTTVHARKPSERDR